jgi:hypothetical protein
MTVRLRLFGGGGFAAANLWRRGTPRLYCADL